MILNVKIHAYGKGCIVSKISQIIAYYCFKKLEFYDFLKVLSTIPAIYWMCMDNAFKLYRANCSPDTCIILLLYYLTFFSKKILNELKHVSFNLLLYLEIEVLKFNSGFQLLKFH